MTNIPRERIVVKYGASSTTNEFGMDEIRIGGYVDQLAPLCDQYDLLVVASGSIAVGTAAWLAGNHGDLPHNQSLAMMGSAEASMAVQRAFAEHGIPAGQLLISHDEMRDVHEGGSLRRTLERNFKIGMVTVANANDAVSDIEERKLVWGGENDGLAEHVADLVNADHVVFMTDQEGVLDENKKLIEVVDRSNIVYARSVSKGPGPKGRGGMREKVNAARRAQRNHINAYIGHADASIQDMLEREPERITGTYFPRPLSRKHSRIRGMHKEAA